MLVPVSASRFLPVQVVNEAAVPEPQSQPKPSSSPRISAGEGRIEITLPDGSRLQVDNNVSLAALRRVMTALRG
jgi:transposase